MKLCSEFWVFYLEFNGAKNPQVLIALNWGHGGWLRILIGVLDLDLNMNKFVWVLGIFFPNSVVIY